MTFDQIERAVDQVAIWLASKPLRSSGFPTITRKQYRSVSLEDRAEAREIVDLVIKAVE